MKNFLPELDMSKLRRTLIAIALGGAFCFPIMAQDLREYRVGLLFYKQDQPIDAAERWLAVAERLREDATNVEERRSAGYGYVLATAAYDVADDDRAYGSWAEAIRTLLEAETRWDLERDRLASRLRDLSSLLSNIDAAEPGAISEEILLLIEFEETLSLTEFQGPRIGLSEPSTQVSGLESAEPREYFAKPLALSESESRSRYREAPAMPSSSDDRSEGERPDDRRDSGERLQTRVAPSLVEESQGSRRGSRPARTVPTPDQEPEPDSSQASDSVAVSPPATPPVEAADSGLPENEVDDNFELARRGGTDNVQDLPTDRVGAAPVAEVSPQPRELSAVERAVARAAERVGDDGAEEETGFVRARVAPASSDEPLVETTDDLVVFGPQIEVAVLDEEEMAVARNAWRYFQENLQVSSGFANAVNKYSTLSMWEMGSCLAGIVSAHQLGIVPKVRFDSMMKRILTSLSRIPIYRDELPNLEYNAATGQMIDTRHRESDRGSGFSALDNGRLLVWLRIIKEWYPDHADAVSSIVDRFDFERVLTDRELHSVQLDRARETVEQQGRLGYEQYSAMGFALWGGSVTRAMDLDDVEYREILGVSVPHDRRPGSFLTSEPFVLAGLELGGISPDLSRLMKSVFEVQQARWDEEAVLTAMSEDSLNQPPWFVYGSIVHGESTWEAFDSTGVSHQQYRGLSTKAAFGWHALFENDFTERLVEVAAQLVHSRYGFFAGLFESGEVNEALSLNTNAVVLESLLYRQRGSRPFLQIDFEPGETRGYRRR